MNKRLLNINKRILAAWEEKKRKEEQNPPSYKKATAWEILEVLGISEEEMEEARRAIAETERSNGKE